MPKGVHMNSVNKLYTLLKASRSAFFYALFFSCIINLLMLTIPIYMLQVFDRVLRSQSIDTLAYLTLIASIALLVLGLLDIARSQLLTKISHWIDTKLSPIALAKSLDHVLEGGSYGAQSLADINTIRQFLNSPSIYAFFDMPWMIIFIWVIFMIYLPLGLFALAGAVILLALALINEMLSRKPIQEANLSSIENQASITQHIKNAETIQSMGMMDSIMQKWQAKNDKMLLQQSIASDRSSIIQGTSKFVRMLLQIGIMALGAYYVVQGELTSGGMIAASIIMGRALAPIEQAISAWKQALSAFQASKRLNKYFLSPNKRSTAMKLPEPRGEIVAESIIFMPSGVDKPILHNIHFSLQPGQCLAIVGPSGAGKSTLARLLVGIWVPTRGTVRLDGANIFEWDRSDIGHHVGYLPQTVHLFPGNIKENIARLGTVNNTEVIEAAQLANAHELILHMKHGYETDIKDYQLSGGQTQRVALARALYGLPKLVVLDEPENNMDQEGLSALKLLIKRLKQKKITLIIVTQRRGLAEACDNVLVLEDGTMTFMGPYTQMTAKKLQERKPPNG